MFYVHFDTLADININSFLSFIQYSEEVDLPLY
jgi:hypothetical protein